MVFRESFRRSGRFQAPVTARGVGWRPAAVERYRSREVIPTGELLGSMAREQPGLRSAQAPRRSALLNVLAIIAAITFCWRASGDRESSGGAIVELQGRHLWLLSLGMGVACGT